MKDSFHKKPELYKKYEVFNTLCGITHANKCTPVSSIVVISKCIFLGYPG